MIGFTIFFIANTFGGAPPAYTLMSEKNYATYKECEVVADKMQEEYRKNYKIVRGFYSCMPFEQNTPFEE